MPESTSYGRLKNRCKTVNYRQNYQENRRQSKKLLFFQLSKIEIRVEMLCLAWISSMIMLLFVVAIEIFV